MAILRMGSTGLRGKLLFLGIIPVAAIFLMLFFSNRSISILEEKLNFAYQVRTKLIVQAGNMSGSIHAIGRWLWIVNGFAGHPEKQSIFLAKATKEIESFERAKADYIRMPRAESVQTEFAKIEELWPKAKDAALRASALFAKNTPDDGVAAKNVLMTDLVKNLVPMTDAFNLIAQSMDAILEKEITDTAEQVAHAKLILAISSAFVGVLTLLFAVVLGMHLTKEFSKIGQSIGEAAKDTSSASLHLSTASQALSTGASRAAASLEETVASLEELNGMVKLNSEHAHHAESLSDLSQRAAFIGQREVADLIHAIGDLAQSSRRIEDITKLIEDISFQTNLLALNAAVEAARAGEQGRGFAVVAEAVRALAQKSAGAAKDISTLIQDNVLRTTKSVGIARKSGDVLTDIVLSVQKVSVLNQEISKASHEQASGLSQINTAMNQIDRTTQENAAASEEVAANSEEMAGQAGQLARLAERLNILIHGRT